MTNERDATQDVGSLVTVASMAAVDEAHAHVAAFCRASAIGPRLERVLILILEELVTNTVTHGRPAPESTIEFTLRRDDGHISLCYRDRGVPFDPLRDREPPDFSKTMRSRPVGGVGWPLIFHYCAEVRYRRLGDANDLALKIPLLEPPP